MPLIRSLFDPIRSRWLKRQITQDNLTHHDYRHDGTTGIPLHTSDRALHLYLRLDDPYSYLLIQHIADISTDFPTVFSNCIVSITTKHTPHTTLSFESWQAYALADAQALAKQHRFDMSDHIPNLTSCAKASQIFGHRQRLNESSLHLLLQLFHILWFNQQAKLNMLLAIQLKRSVSVTTTQPDLPEHTVLVGYFSYHEQIFEGLNGLYGLVRQFKKENILPADAAFFIDHIHWQDDLLINDPELVREIHELKPQLELFIAPEDPRSYLVLDYLMTEMASHYHIKLKLRLLPYQGLDKFDWQKVALTAQQMGVDFAPFCRPTMDDVTKHVNLLYHYKKSTRNIATRALLQSVWTKANPRISADALDNNVRKVLHAEQRKRHVTDDVTSEDVQSKLKKNQRIYDTLEQPTLPAMRMTVGNETHVWSGIERLWRIQTILADQIEDTPTA